MKVYTPFFDSPKSLLQKRIWAFTIDLVAIIIIERLLILSFANFLRTFFYQLPYANQFALQDNMIKIHLITLAVVFVSYFSLSYYLGEGKTPGKMFFNLRVYPDHHLFNDSNTEWRSELGFVECFTRGASYLFCYILGCVLFFMPFMRKDARGVPDFFSGTCVYDENQYQEQYNAYLNFQQKIQEYTWGEQLLLFPPHISSNITDNDNNDENNHGPQHETQKEVA